MAPLEHEDSALLHSPAQQEAEQAQLEELNRRISALQADNRLYQTRMFAYERSMIALRRENAELEQKYADAAAMCESLSAQLEEALKAEKLPQPEAAADADEEPDADAWAERDTQVYIPKHAAQPKPSDVAAEPEVQEEAEAAQPDAAVQEPIAEPKEPELAATEEEPQTAEQQPEPVPAAKRTELEQLSDELIAEFDRMMPR